MMDIFFYTFVSLFSIINPIGMSAIFLDLTQKFSKDERSKAAYLVGLYGGLLLLATFFVGTYVLKFFGISLSSIQVAGGMLVFYCAWGMLNTKTKDENQKLDNKVDMDNIFFPLTMPITAGAGSIAVTIALAVHLESQNLFSVLPIAEVIAAIIAVFLVVIISYRFSENIFRKLGKTGTSVVSSLSAFILLAIGVTVIWDGILGLITSSKLGV